MGSVGFLGAARRGTLKTILGLVLLCSVPTTAHAYSLRLAENGESLQWWEESVSLRLDPSMETIVPDGQVSPAVEAAIGTWVGSGLLPLDLQIEVARVSLVSTDGARGNGQNDLYVHEGEWPHARTWSAVTELTFDECTGEILEADIVLDRDRQWALGDRIGPTSLDLRGIVTHELGHLLGLSESTEPDAVMFQECNVGEVCRRQLTSDDELALAAAYGSAESLGRAVGCSMPPSAVSAGDRGQWSLGLLVAAALAAARRRRVGES